MLNLHTATETPADPEANVNWGVTQGPVRTGAYARNNTNRIYAGGGYYGCMEISSNVWEFCVNVGKDVGRAYTGNHGDAKISTNGTHDVVAWPEPSQAWGAGVRGGNFLSTNEYARLSGRAKVSQLDPFRHQTYGGRGVRTAE